MLRFVFFNALVLMNILAQVLSLLAQVLSLLTQLENGSIQKT